MKNLLAFFFSLFALTSMAQKPYDELPNPRPTADAWSHVPSAVVGWGSTDVRYAKEAPAEAVQLQRNLNLTGWRGERVSALVVLSAPEALQHVACQASFDADPRTGSTLSEALVPVPPVRYVMTDELNRDGLGACGHRRAQDFDSSLVADVIDLSALRLDVAARTTQTFWLSFDIPENAEAGTYHGQVKLSSSSHGLLGALPFTVSVLPHTLSQPSCWHFHLDLWQNPYASAEFYGTEPFSDAHFEAMRQDFTHYAEAGGKVVTATITDRPWDGQTYTPFASMVTWTKQKDGAWRFDFTAFDRWVSFMESIGVREQINCYSMVPWRLRFQYFDEATGTDSFLEASPSDAAYAEFWTRMLKAFAQHLREKGWMEKTCIAMDERPMDVMLQTLRIIRSADPEFKVALAGTYHSELSGELFDYCVAIGEQMPEDVRLSRRSKGLPTTFYTCCTEARPNTFTFSPPAEAEWLGWYAAAWGFDGYLRWALNSWTAAPLQDSRFRSWAAGDCYLLYPAGRTSVRFERLREGIQAYEKLRQLQAEADEKEDAALRRRLDAFRHHLQGVFTFPFLDENQAAAQVREARDVLNAF